MSARASSTPMPVPTEGINDFSKEPRMSVILIVEVEDQRREPFPPET
jgi:hypothetical protein